MTREEALEILKDHEYWANVSLIDDAVEVAIEVLKRADRYRWHDLRKNPEDLPARNHDVLTCCKNEINKYAYFVMWLNDRDRWLFQNNRPCCDIVAWREIEPFEEVEE